MVNSAREVSGIPRQPCRCLTADLPDAAALSRLLTEWLGQIPEEERTESEETAWRLDRCRRCDFLQDGTCALCGCYVELRAAKRRMRCPDLPDRWSSEEELRSSIPNC